MFITLPCCPWPQTLNLSLKWMKGVSRPPARRTPKPASLARRLSPGSYHLLFFTESRTSQEAAVLELSHLVQGSKYYPWLCPLCLGKMCPCCFLTAQRNSHATGCSGRLPGSTQDVSSQSRARQSCVLRHKPSRGWVTGGQYVQAGKGCPGRRLGPTQVSGGDCKTRKVRKSQHIWSQITLKKQVQRAGPSCSCEESGAGRTCLVLC